jgi:hypothetical protein
MATRSIVTSRPDVECDVCERRLLRGEQPEYFLVAGQRRTVCELCAPRATHEGWLRESDQAALELPPMRPRRGRSLFERLVALTRPAPPARRGDAARAGQAAAAAEERPYDVFGDQEAGLDLALAAPPVEDGGEAGDVLSAPVPAERRSAREPDYPEQAVDAFNASEFPRRVAGVARSLGEPLVSVRSAEHLASVVRIVVAWELCWYRYEVDLGDERSGVRLIAQGSELDELDELDRAANATADERGELRMLAL